MSFANGNEPRLSGNKNLRNSLHPFSYSQVGSLNLIREEDNVNDQSSMTSDYSNKHSKKMNNSQKREGTLGSNLMTQSNVSHTVTFSTKGEQQFNP
jgi:hypothetical protein